MTGRVRGARGDGTIRERPAIAWKMAAMALPVLQTESLRKYASSTLATLRHDLDIFLTPH